MGPIAPRGACLARQQNPWAVPLGQRTPLSMRCRLTAWSSRGVLRISWSYDSNRYEEETICRLASRYQHYLSETIAHCKGVKEAVKTASDYGLAHYGIAIRARGL